MRRGACAVVPLVGAALLASGSARATDPDPWLGRDKVLHFGVSTGLAGAGYGFSAIGTDDIRLRIAFGAGTGIVLGAAKEILDLAGFGTPSWKDFTWDLIGTAVGVGIAVSIDLAVRSFQPKASPALRTVR